MCINKKHKKQNLPIVTPKTEKDGWKVVLLYFFFFCFFLYCGKGEWLNQRGRGREGGANRHWNHLWYAFCLACSASNQSIKINVCAQSDTRLEKPQSPMPYPLDRTSADPSQLPTSKSASKIYVRPLFCLCIRFCITGDCISVPFSLFRLFV